MPVLSSDIKFYTSNTMAVDFSTPTIGGAFGSTLLTGGSVGEVFFKMSPNRPSGADKVQYQKIFVKNNSASDLNNAGIYMANNLTVFYSGYTILTVESLSDADFGIVRTIGYDNTNISVQEDILLNGSTSKSGNVVWGCIYRAEVRDFSTPNALQTVFGDVRLHINGDMIGRIPAGYGVATSEVVYSIETSLNGSDTAADAAHPPSVFSPFDNRTQETSVGFSNATVLTAGMYQGIWLLWTLKANIKPSLDVQIVLVVQGNSA